MAKKSQFFFSIFLFIFSSITISSHSASINSSSSSCPIDFSYVTTFPWDTSTCNHPSQPITTGCCQALRSLFGIGLARHLKQTATFYLPDPPSSASCLSDFQSRLSSMSVPHRFSSCLNDTNEFVASPSNCAGISTLKDWIDKAGANTSLDTSCNEDLTGFLRCRSCVDAGLLVNSQLVSLSPNSTKCFFFTVLYAAGIVNDFGPEDVRSANCILGIPLSTSRDKNGSKKQLILAVSGAFLGVSLVLGVVVVYRKLDKKRKQNAFHRDYVRSVKARVLPNTGAKWFRIAELDVATNGFSQKNFIGQGGYGVVYKGTLADGTVVAVKQMFSLDSDQGDEDFVNEAEIISKIRHRNLLPLRGFCVTSDPIKGNQRYLVYDFMPNGSLYDHIFYKDTSVGSSLSPDPAVTSKRCLSWPQRKNIIIDVAKGLAYLHNGVKPAIFHRDIKATNILLDSEMKARVADFGLAKQSKDGQSHLTTRVAGTYGYLAPEYALYGQLTEKSDVYSFGIIVLEVMSGRKVLEEGTNTGMVLITDWAWDMVKLGKIEDVFDRSMSQEGTLPKSVMERFVRVGILCGHVMVALRPTISDALKMLEGDIDIPRLPDRPLPLSHESFRSSFRHSNGLWSSEGSRASSSNQIA